MAKLKVLKPVNLTEEKKNLVKDDVIEMTLKRAEEIEKDVASLDGFENYGPIFERIEE